MVSWTRASSRRLDTRLFSHPESVRATSPESVYSQQSSQPPVQDKKQPLGRNATPRLRRRLGLLDKQNGRPWRVTLGSRRGGSIQMPGYLTNRLTGCDPSRDVLSIRPCGGLDGSAGRLPGESLREATTNSE